MADSPASVPSVPPKPIRSKKWALIAVCAVAGIYTILMLLDSGKPAAKPKPDQVIANAAAASPEAGQNFNDQLQREANNLLAKRQQMQATAQNFTSLADVVSHLPACDDAERAKLRGQYYVAIGPNSQTIRLACDSNNVWTPVPDEVSGIQPMTPQQERAAGSAGGAGNEGLSKKERLAQARQAALDSSSVALDYSSAKPVVEKGNAPVAESTPAQLLPASAESPEKTPAYPWDTYSGSLYRVFEGDVIEAILTNRLAGEFSGPVNVMVTTNLYSHDRQHILIPQGTRILGESSRVSVAGQRRLAVVFHRVIMPDGFSVDLDKFAALDQQGASGLTGRVSTHWPKMIATAVLIGAIGGLAQVGNSGTLTTAGQIRIGVGQQTGQEATQILDRMLNVLPTVTIFEGTRVRIWVQRDLTLPAYEHHTVLPTL